MLQRLLSILKRLYTETEGFLDEPENQQHWYNRGYANGIAEALADLGYAEQLNQQVQLDAPDIIAGHEALAWGQAYQHGKEMGEQETREVLPPHPAGRVAP